MTLTYALFGVVIPAKRAPLPASAENPPSSFGCQFITRQPYAPRKKMRLTKPLLEAIENALNAALVGEGFEGGDFDGERRDHYERALEWARQEQRRRFDG